MVVLQKPHTPRRPPSTPHRGVLVPQGRSLCTGTNVVWGPSPELSSPSGSWGARCVAWDRRLCSAEPLTCPGDKGECPWGHRESAAHDASGSCLVPGGRPDTADSFFTPHPVPKHQEIPAWGGNVGDSLEASGKVPRYSPLRRQPSP